MRLKHLSVENFILVQKAELEFCPGFNVLTGETGAGKTMLLSAIAAIAGSRVDWEVFKGQNALVEAVFQEPGRRVSIRRHISGKQKRSKIWIDDQPVSVAELRNIMSKTIAVHGQRENQKLLNEDEHLFYLDAFGGLVQDREDFARLWARKQQLAAEIGQLEARLKRAEEARELREFQLKEIEDAQLEPNEEELLRDRLKLLNAGAELAETIGSCVAILQEDEGSAIERVSRALSQMERFSDTGSVSEIMEQLSIGRDQLAEAVRAMLSLGDSLDHDPEELNRINQRLFTISRLKQKYKTDVPGLLQLAEELKKELTISETGWKRLESMRAELGRLDKQLDAKAQQLSQTRKQTASRLSDRVRKELAQLGMAGAMFQVELEPGPESPSGRDSCRFMLSANPGQPLLPLVKVASGGELSRVMLALETGLAAAENTPVLIFDEVDQGIGGRIAEAVGKKLKALAEHHQVITVTHLPQIAAKAERHFVVVKSGADVSIKQLSPEERVHEIARMSAGQDITPEAVSLARRLLSEE